MMYCFFSNIHKPLFQLHWICLPWVSNYWINWLKSSIPLINCFFHNSSLTSLQSRYIKFLGINVSPRLADLTNLNHIPVLKKVEDLARWKSVHIYLTGRVTSIKLMVFPRISYLFSVIQSKPLPDWFRSLDSSISEFPWKENPVYKLRNATEHRG